MQKKFPRSVQLEASCPRVREVGSTYIPSGNEETRPCVCQSYASGPEESGSQCELKNSALDNLVSLLPSQAQHTEEIFDSYETNVMTDFLKPVLDLHGSSEFPLLYDPWDHGHLLHCSITRLNDIIKHFIHLQSLPKI